MIDAVQQQEMESEVSAMRIESSITAVSWIPSGSVNGVAKLPFSMGVTHYDEQPPRRLGDMEILRRDGRVREVNHLRAWIEVDGGRVVNYGFDGPAGFVGSTDMDLGWTRLTVRGKARPVIRRRPVVSSRSVRFFQTVGGRTGVPFPRLTSRPPFFAWHSSTAWTTLVLTLHVDGRSEGWLLGASHFPRHTLYDHDGRLVGETASTDFRYWFSNSYGGNTPWGGRELEPLELREVVPAAGLEVA